MSGILYETGADLVTSTGEMTGVGSSVARSTWYELVIGWDRGVTGYFTLDRSLLDGPDPLAPQPLVVPNFDGPYDDVTRQLERITWSRGRSRTLDTVEAGTVTIELRDPGYIDGGVWRPGLFNPKNTGSPLYPLTNDPLRPIRFRAYTLPGPTITPLGYWFLRTLDYRPNQRGGIVTIEATDLLLRLQRNPPAIAPTGATTTGAAIGVILDAIGWNDPLYRSLDAGDQIPDFAEADGKTSALELVQDLLATELGLFRADGAGVAVYENRNARGVKPVSATITNRMTAVGPGSSLDTIVNRATFTKQGSTPQTYTDELSADPLSGYGVNAAPEVESPYLFDDDDALARATYVVNTSKDPSGPLWKLDLDGRDLDLLGYVLDLEVSDRIQVAEASGLTVGDYYVERLEHSIDRGQELLHRASYVLSERGTPPFVLDSSLLDGMDVLPL